MQLGRRPLRVLLHSLTSALALAAPTPSAGGRLDHCPTLRSITTWHARATASASHQMDLPQVAAPEPIQHMPRTEDSGTYRFGAEGYGAEGYGRGGTAMGNSDGMLQYGAGDGGLDSQTVAGEEQAYSDPSQSVNDQPENLEQPNNLGDAKQRLDLQDSPTNIFPPATLHRSSPMLPGITPAPSYSSVSGLSCSLASTTFASDAVSAYCACNSGSTRSLNTNPSIHDPCPPTAAKGSQASVTPADRFKNTYRYYDSREDLVQCEWGLPVHLPNGKTTTECAGSITTVSTRPTPSLSLIAPTGQGVFVGQMTGAAFQSNFSSALVKGCTKTSVMASDAFSRADSLPAPTPRTVIACEPTMTVSGVPYPVQGSPGVRYDGVFSIIAREGTLFEDLQKVRQFAEVAAKLLDSLPQGNKSAMCPPINPSYTELGGTSWKRRLMERMPLPIFAAQSGKTVQLPVFERCFIPARALIEFYSAMPDSHGTDDRLHLRFNFEGVKPGANVWDEDVCMASMAMGAASMVGCEIFPPICPLMTVGNVALSTACGIGGVETGQEAETYPDD